MRTNVTRQFHSRERNIRYVVVSFPGTKVHGNETSRYLFTARCYASVVLAMGLCPSVCLCLSQAGVLLKRQNLGSHRQHHMIPQGL